MEGEEYIPKIKSRQPGTVKSNSPSNTTLDKVEGSDHEGDIGIAKFIGFDKGSQVSTKDTGIFVQP